jgi:hypothetical protein
MRICARLPEWGASLIFFFPLDTFPVTFTVLQDEMGSVFFHSFVLELEGTEPQENTRGFTQNCLQTDSENENGFNLWGRGRSRTYFLGAGEGLDQES